MVMGRLLSPLERFPTFQNVTVTTKLGFTSTTSVGYKLPAAIKIMVVAKTEV